MALCHKLKIGTNSDTRVGEDLSNKDVSSRQALKVRNFQGHHVRTKYDFKDTFLIKRTPFVWSKNGYSRASFS